MLAGITIELDGVLVDGVARRWESLVGAFAAAGIELQIDARTLDRSADFETLVADCIRAHPANAALTGLDDTARALIALRAERDDRARVAAGVTLVSGARDAIAALALEWRTAVVTMWSRTDAERVLALAGLDDVVRFVVAADDGPGFASARARYTRVLSRLGRAGTAGTVAALVAGSRGAAAAHAAGARALVVGDDVLMAELSPARLAAAVDAPAP